MRFPPPHRRPAQDTLLPMINVVFLLLIFFLISAQMVPPEPFAVTPPQAIDAAEAAGDFTLYIGADGALGYRAQLGDGALPALVAQRALYCGRADCATMPPRLSLRADAALPAARLAALLPQLAAAGFAGVEMITTARAP